MSVSEHPEIDGALMPSNGLVPPNGSISEGSCLPQFSLVRTMVTRTCPTQHFFAVTTSWLRFITVSLLLGHELAKPFPKVVAARSETTKKDVQDHLTNLGLREATMYVDDDGVQYSRDIAKKMTPGWMVEWLYGKSPET
ncbi:hypothetical protein CPAR01_09907 [Colletotrichum paranaense]|uniref:Uncharacterized protein n=1 Tax=Colletotrichum paranaense TaxID=1914294 RepID=A0ABQ9SCH5_9PEZI|nr:uncharacterized protein CPAR01_09907 [Colletotrichum paranaense]KAK1533199.1 hypothetical protein CPAR01_09907 [Colletotrichum paranaense]